MADMRGTVRSTESGGGGTTAFVLSGGGSLAAVQVGMLQALAAREIRPDLFIGSSTGALNAAFVAGRGFSAETLDELAGIWRSLARGDVSPFRLHGHLVTSPGSHLSLSAPNGLARVLSKHLTYDDLERALVPVHIVVADVPSGREVLLSRGPAAAALLASAAAPSVLTETHIRHAAALGASRVFVLPAGIACALASPPQAGLAKAVHDVTLRAAQRVVREAAAFEDEVELIVLPPLCPLAVPTTDFRHAEELIVRAQRDTLSWLDEGGHRHPSRQPVWALHIHPVAGGNGGGRQGGQAA